MANPAGAPIVAKCAPRRRRRRGLIIGVARGAIMSAARVPSNRSPRWKNASATFAILLLAIAGPSFVTAQENASVLDPDQGEAAVETGAGSEHDETTAPTATKKKKGMSFIPVPIFITEPAIGYGFGAAVGYFHGRKGDGAAAVTPGLTARNAEDLAPRKRRPPNISGIAAAYTERGSWGVGVGHSASWRDDRIRYFGGVGYANLDAEFWFFDLPFDGILAGMIVVQDLTFRVGTSDFFLGGKLTYMNTDVEVKLGLEQLPITIADGRVEDLGLGVHAFYEGRDNKMTPNFGQFVELLAEQHFESRIGDYDYQRLGFEVQSFHPIAHRRFVLGLRLKIDAAFGDPPFWGYPWISLRGVSALRYQNDLAGSLEAELRWNLFERWAVVVFGGGGATTGDALLFVDQGGIYAGGIGGRYLFRPQDSLWIGLDLASGPDNGVFYVQVGHAW
ncbi:hypothetical protein ACFLQM_01775 [Acidobacteriota bacterium]